VIRPARPDELELIRTIVHDAYVGYVERIGGRPGPMDSDYAALLDEGAVHVIDCDPPPGLIVLSDRPDHLLVENVAVAPQTQGRGHGGALLRFAEAEARRRGFAELRLYTHERMTENLSLYAHLGYEQIGRRPEHGFPRVYLSKRIAN
jgi:ribosomal protein S18 acetylase RimI-like enzyme